MYMALEIIQNEFLTDLLMWIVLRELNQDLESGC